MAKISQKLFCEQSQGVVGYDITVRKALLPAISNG